jgi:hypothetical protein
MLVLPAGTQAGRQASRQLGKSFVEQLNFAEIHLPRLSTAEHGDFNNHTATGSAAVLKLVKLTRLSLECAWRLKSG